MIKWVKEGDNSIGASALDGEKVLLIMQAAGYTGLAGPSNWLVTRLGQPGNRRN